MFNNFISNLQVYNARTFNGMTESNHLSNAFLTEPEKVGTVMSLAFGKYNGNVLTLLTGGIGNKSIANREYEWDLYANSDRSIEVTGNLGDGGSTPGLGQTIFRVKLAEKWFESTDNLISDNGTKVRVAYEPVQDGTSFIYHLQLTGNDKTRFIDPSQIALGARFSKDFSTVSEFSSKGGGTQYIAPFKMRNQLTTLRKHYEVTRSAATDRLVISVPNPENPKETTKLWVKNAEWTAIGQWYRELERSYVYSEFSKDSSTYFDVVQGENGRPVYEGAGLRQQIAPANIRYYTTLTYKILDDFLLDLSYAADIWGGDCKFLALTGKMGMREFDRAIREEIRVNGGITVVDDGKFIAGSGQELIFQGQFTTVKFLNGIELTVKEFPIYDDIVRNRALHPITKKPQESYRFTILNIGRKEGRSNLRKMYKEDSEMLMWNVSGSVDPYGNTAKSTSTSRASGIDGFQVHFLAECGIMLEDPTTAGELIFQVE